jgi:adenosine deaminase
LPTGCLENVFGSNIEKLAPVLQNFAKDGANFSINTDDPTVTGTYLDDEFKLLHSWGLRESTFTKAVSCHYYQL